LAFLLYRHLESRATRLLIYGLTTFFTLGYPLAGLLTEIRHRNAFDGLVQAGLIVYLFVLALVDRLSRQERDGHVGGSGLTQEGSLS
jgi:predicted MFS family arabinose efflux permease